MRPLSSGLQTSPMFPEGKHGASEAKAMLTSEIQKWAKVIKSAGVSAPNWF